MRSNRLFLLIVVLCGLLALGANSVVAQEDVVLEIWVRTEQLLPAFDAYNAQMEAEGRNVRVEYQVVEGTDFPAKFTAALSAGEAPDVVSIDLILVPAYNQLGAFLDLTDQLAEYEYADQLNEAMLSLGTWDGRVYALPFAADSSALIYNRDLFEAAGLDPDVPPTSWDELLSYAQQLTSDEVYGYGFAGASAGGLMFTFMPYAWANGGLWLSEDGTQAMVNDPQTVEAVQFFHDMIHEHQVAPPNSGNYSWDDFQTGFTSGQIAMITSGNFMVSYLKNDFPDLDFGVALVPSRDGESFSSFVGGDLIAIPATSDFPAEAWEFVQYLLSEDVQVDVFARNGIIPVRRDLVDNEYFEAEPRYRVFADAIATGYVPFTTVYNELYNPFLAGMQNALLNLKPVQEALDEAAAEMQRVIDRAR